MFAEQESLKSFLNVLTVSAFFTSDGKLFHAQGAAVWKARSPRRRRLRIVNKSLLSTDRKVTWQSRVETGCNMQLVQFWAPTVEPTPDHYFDNSTGFQYANSSSTGPRCWHVEWTRLVSRPTWRNISFNASHLVRSAQLHHRYCLSRDWSLISQDVHSPTPHLSFGTVCLQKSCCMIWNIVLKDILRHSCLIAVWLILHQRLCSLL